jgi:hypothetical protein
VSNAKNSRGYVRRREQLTEAFENLSEEDAEYAYEFRITMLVDIRKFNASNVMNHDGVIAAIPGNIVHFSGADKQRKYARDAKAKERSQE